MIKEKRPAQQAVYEVEVHGSVSFENVNQNTFKMTVDEVELQRLLRLLAVKYGYVKKQDPVEWLKELNKTKF